MSMDAAFRALADASRRALLDRLREKGGQSLGELCMGLSMSRQAVTKHLGILEAANLVSTRKEGRRKLHFLNPVPIHEIGKRWIGKFERPHLDALSDLKRKLESPLPADEKSGAAAWGACGFLFDANDHKVLLHLRDGNTFWNPNRWAFFGGNGEASESFRDCFVRELREEIGLSIAPQEAIALRVYRHKSGQERAVFYVRSAVAVSELTLGEGADMRWIGLDELDRYDLTEATRDDLQFFVAQLERETRERDGR
jgi:DNA-binding transcriptional ArsR family regulator/8-oxo-dGTP pyrophosphatase MutT (NUDIX family)